MRQGSMHRNPMSFAKRIVFPVVWSSCYTEDSDGVFPTSPSTSLLFLKRVSDTTETPNLLLGVSDHCDTKCSLSWHLVELLYDDALFNFIRKHETIETNTSEVITVIICDPPVITDSEPLGISLFPSALSSH